MVSIESRNGFLKQLEADPDARVMVAFIFGKDISSLSTNGRLADQVVNAIVNSDSKAFQDIVGELNERKIHASSDWIYDDYLLLALVVASRKFDYGNSLCKNILGSQNATEKESQSLHTALLQYVAGSNAVDGDFSFAKFVFRELINPEELKLEEARTVYRELTSIADLHSLPTMPRLLALRAFDLVVEKNVKPKLDTSRKIACEIQSLADHFSLGDWIKIFLAMKPKFLWGLGVAFFVVLGTAFGLGTQFSSNETKERLPQKKTVESNPATSNLSSKQD